MRGADPPPIGNTWAVVIFFGGTFVFGLAFRLHALWLGVNAINSGSPGRTGDLLLLPLGLVCVALVMLWLTAAMVSVQIDDSGIRRITAHGWICIPWAEIRGISRAGTVLVVDHEGGKTRLFGLRILYSDLPGLVEYLKMHLPEGAAWEV